MLDLSALLGGQQAPAGTGTVLAPQQPGPMMGGYMQPGLEQYMNPIQQQSPIAALAQGFMHGLTGGGSAPGGMMGGLGNFAGGVLGSGQGFTHTGPQVGNATSSHQIGLKTILSML